MHNTDKKEIIIGTKLGLCIGGITNKSTFDFIIIFKIKLLFVINY